jgi:chromate transporter
VEVLRIFLRLGLTSFGGPVAHLGYFCEQFVARRRWLQDAAFADLVALCQFLPGPASSQVGFSIGLMRAGLRGALAAWAGFTLPAACVMVLFAYGVHAFAGAGGQAALHGLQLAAVAVVAQAVVGMARSLCPDWPRAGIAFGAALIVLWSGSAAGQIAVIALGALCGAMLTADGEAAATGPLPVPVTRRHGLVALGLYLVLLGLTPLLQWRQQGSVLALFAAFYRSGALVFGGGHVVLPLLRQAFVPSGWIADQTFLAGYGAAQALPGPLFSFAAFLGATAGTPPFGIAGALVGLFGIFLPGLLILVATLPYWGSVRGHTRARAAMRGVNAAVVGILAAAWIHPVSSGAVRSLADAAIAGVGLLLLLRWRAPPLLVVASSTLGAIACAHWLGRQ